MRPLLSGFGVISVRHPEFLVDQRMRISIPCLTMRLLKTRNGGSRIGGIAIASLECENGEYVQRGLLMDVGGSLGDQLCLPFWFILQGTFASRFGGRIRHSGWSGHWIDEKRGSLRVNWAILVSFNR